jgi:tetratricopeptide (TPR) repeat protein
MLNPEILSLLNNKYSCNEQSIILRAVIQNPIIEKYLNTVEFQKKLQTKQIDPIKFFRPASLALNSLGLDIKLSKILISEPFKTPDPDLLRQAQDIYQRILLQKGYQAKLEDAYLVALCLRENFIQNKSWQGISEKTMAGEFADSEKQKYFWSLVLTCLSNIIPDSWNIYRQILMEKPTQENIEIVIQSLLENPSSNDELLDVISKILLNQRLATNIRFLDTFDQYSLPEIVQGVARSLISLSPHFNIGIDEIDKTIQSIDWINADDLAQKIQHIAILNAFAGDQEKANALIERVKVISEMQDNALDKIQRKLLKKIKSSIHDNGNKIKTETREFLNNEKNNLFQDSPFEKVEELISSADFYEASKQLEKIKPYRKSDLAFFRLSAEIDFQLGGYQAAKNDLLFAHSLDQSDRGVKRLLARSYFHMEEYSKAFDIADSIYDLQEEFTNEEISEICEYALKNNKPEVALRIIEEKYPKGYLSAGINLQVAESYFQLNKISAALDYLKKAIDLDKNNPQIWLLLTKIEYADGDEEKALEALITAKRYTTNSQEICFELSKRHFESGNKTAFEEMISEMIQAPLISVSLTKAITQFLKNNKNYQSAFELINRSLIKWPKNVDLAILLAELLNEKKSYIEASSILENLNKNNLLDVKGIQTYLFSLLRSNSLIFPLKAELSEDCLQKGSELISQLLKNAPDDGWTKIIQAEFLHLQKKNSESFDAYRNLLSDLPAQRSDLLWRMQIGMGRILIELGQTDTAIALLSEALKKSPLIFEIHQFIANVYLSNGLEEKAMQIANHAIVQFLDNPSFCQWYAHLIAQIKNKDSAINWLKDEVKKHKEQNGFSLLMASVEMELGNKENVEKLLNETVKQTNLTPAQLRIIANIFARIGKISQSIDLLTRLQITPTNDQKKINFELAGLHRQQNNIKETEKVLQEALDENDEVYLQKLFLAELFFKSNNLELMKPLVLFLAENLEKTQKKSTFYYEMKVSDDYLFPDEWKRLFHAKENIGIFLAKCLFLLGEFGKSLDIAEKALNINPMNLALCEYSADLAYSLLLDSKAEQLANVELNRIEGKQKDSDNYLGLICLRAELALHRGEDLHAASLITNSLQGNEDNPRLQCLQAQLLNRQGDFENAAKFFEKAKVQIPQLRLNNSNESKPALPEIWLLETAKELRDYHEVFLLISEMIKSGNNLPRVILTFLKTKIDLDIFIQQAKELMIKNNVLKKPLNHLDTDSIIEKAVANYLYNDPELIQWQNLYKLMQGFENDEIFIQEATDIIPFLAFWYRKSNNLEGLKSLAQKYSDIPDVHFQIGLALMANDPAESKKQLDEAIALNSHNPIYYAALAILEKRNSDPQKALTAIEQGLILWPNEENWHIFAAEMAEKVEDKIGELKHLEEAFEIEPQNLLIRGKLIKAYYQNNRISDAARMIKELKNQGAESFEELVILAKSALADKNYKESFDYANRANSLDVKSPIPYSILGELALKLNKLDKASEYSQRAVQCDPENVEAHIVMSRIIGAQKDKTSALYYLELLLRKGIKTNLILCEISSLKKEMFGTKFAFEFLLDYQNENDEIVLCQLALFAMEMNNLKDAEIYANASLNLNPHQANLKKILGQIAQQKGDLDKAVKYFSGAIQCEPENSERYLDVCDIYIYRREVMKALDVLNQGIAINNNDWRIYQKAGKIYWEMKDFIKAESMLRQAIEYNPTDQQLKQQLATISAMNIIHQKQEILS